MLNKDFFKLLAVSFAMAAPVAFYLMNRWLEGFVYRITLQWWMFVLAGVVAGAVVFTTTGYQSIRASLENPIKSLRTE
jgi:putative ABC transport system permease protein